MTEVVNFGKEHLSPTFEWMQNEGLKEMFLLDKDITKQSHLNWFKQIQDDVSQEIFAILYDGTHVGNIGLKNIDQKNGKAEVWIYLGNIKYRGKGIAKDSLFQLESKKKNIIRKFYAQIASFNSQSIKTFMSAGYHIEGILQKEVIFKSRLVDIFRLYRMV